MKQNSKNKSAKDLAVQLVGDGKKPNKYFVTIGYGWYMPKDSEDMKQAKNSLDSVTMLFNTREAAEQCYQSITPMADSGKITGLTIGQVMIEDRLTGVIKEKFLSHVSGNLYRIKHY